METAIPLALWYLAFIFALTVHEWAHAWTANKCGDPTARLMGRMTLNPFPHIDPVGTVIIPLLGGFLGGMSLFGWGKPVPVNPSNLRGGSRDDVLVSLAGPFSNIVTAVVTLLLIKLMIVAKINCLGDVFPQFLFNLTMVSVSLAFFNILPIPPLDGSHVLRHLLPHNGRRLFDQLAQHGWILLLLFINVPWLYKPYFTLVWNLVDAVFMRFLGFGLKGGN